MHVALPVRQTAPAGNFPRVPPLVAIGVREWHAGDAVGTGVARPGVIGVVGMTAAAAVVAGGSLGVVGARPVGYFGGAGACGFVVRVVMASAEGELGGYGGSVLGGI